MISFCVPLFLYIRSSKMGLLKSKENYVVKKILQYIMYYRAKYAG